MSRDITPLLRSSATVASVGWHAGGAVSVLVMVVARDIALLQGITVGVGLTVGIFMMTPFIAVEAPVNHGAFPHIVVILSAPKALGSLLLQVLNVRVIEPADAGFHDMQHHRGHRASVVSRCQRSLSNLRLAGPFDR